MKKIIIITGPMGVGKSVTGKLLCDKLGRAAFIDGDWCLDIHPFVGNKETVDMAIDNIVHMARNYYKCSESDAIVLGWVISEKNIKKILSGLMDLDMKAYCITLICDENTLRNRWSNDNVTEWRDNNWLEKSIESLENYRNVSADSIVIDTSNMTIDAVAGNIIQYLV